MYGTLPLGGSREQPYFLDGHKFVCGLERINTPPIVYSFGSFGDQSFESEILSIRPDSQIYIFEIDSTHLIPVDKRNPKITYLNYGLGYGTVFNHTDWEVRSLKDIMIGFNHSYIDIFKIDIEGDERKFFGKEHHFFKRMGQILIELHKAKYAKEDVELIESYGLRIFHQEINLYCLHCSEFALIQSDWIIWNQRKLKFNPVN